MTPNDTMLLLDRLHLESLLANIICNTAHPLADADSSPAPNFNGSESSSPNPSHVASKKGL